MLDLTLGHDSDKTWAQDTPSYSDWPTLFAQDPRGSRPAAADQAFYVATKPSR